MIDADAVYHKLLEQSAPLRQALVERFGLGILDGDRLDRKRLGREVFQDPEALADLNRITHRFITAEIDRQAEEAARLGKKGIALDAIALIESGAADQCDVTVAVLASKEVRIRRIMDREGISEDYARSRVQAQQEDVFYRSHCDCVLENDGTNRKEFQRRAEELFSALLKEEQAK